MMLALPDDEPNATPCRFACVFSKAVKTRVYDTSTPRIRPRTGVHCVRTPPWKKPQSGSQLSAMLSRPVLSSASEAGVPDGRLRLSRPFRSPGLQKPSRHVFEEIGYV